MGAVISKMCVTEDDPADFLIVAKATMMNGFCYIGWDLQNEELVRPILRTGANQCCWLAPDPLLEVGEVHRFNVVGHNLPQIPHPHRADDVHVQYRAIDGVVPIPDMYNLLAPVSHERVEDVFGNAEILENRYIIEGTPCPSVGIYRCKRRNLNFHVRMYNDNIKKRCTIQQEAGGVGAARGHLTSFDLPRTYLFYANNGPVDGDVLVVLGLGRPYAGSTGQFNPKRCYLLIVGIINHQ